MGLTFDVTADLKTIPAERVGTIPVAVSAAIIVGGWPLANCTG